MNMTRFLKLNADTVLAAERLDAALDHVRQATRILDDAHLDFYTLHSEMADEVGSDDAHTIHHRDQTRQCLERTARTLKTIIDSASMLRYVNAHLKHHRDETRLVAKSLLSLTSIPEELRSNSEGRIAVSCSPDGDLTRQ